MDVLISVDMEGITGITTYRQTLRGTDDYPWARRIMTEEANGAVAGAFDGGATGVIVTDSHGDMGNLLPAELDPRADLVQGTPKTPWSMLTGIETGMACAMFVGYHAGAGTANAILDHTYTGWFSEVRMNGEPWNETYLNAALAGTFGVPVGLVTGDRACCEQATAVLPWAKTVAVKEGLGNRVGRSLSPERAGEAIRTAAASAVADIAALRNFVPDGPFTLELDTTTTVCADMCAVMPGTVRTGPRTLTFTGADYREVYRALLAWMHLGRNVAPSPQV